MVDKKIVELAEEFEYLTIKKQMKILAYKASGKKIFYREIMDEFEKTLLTAILEKYDYNITKVSRNIKLHRNTIMKKMKKMNIRVKKSKLKKERE